MATVNKSSLRAEFDALKARFESLCAAGKMSADSRALFDALLMLFELLMAVFMEKHTPKSSANSSLPASQSPNDDTARTRPGAKGKGPSSNGERCANTRTREYVKVLSVDACGRCGEDLTDAACTGHERRTLIDIVFEKVVRHVDAQIKHCARCHTETRAHQRYCSAKECRCASKAASQRRWLAKAENRDYFRGPEHVARVRAWRTAHPGYAREKSSRRRALQEHSSAQPVDIDEQSDVLSVPALQDLSRAQSPVLTGLIAHLTGAALQEDIAVTSRRLQHLALDIVQGDPDGRETIALPQPPATHPRAVQLARPPLG